MPITEGEWVSIRTMIESLANKKGEYFTTGKVLKRDEGNKLVWTAEFGDQPIPLVAFDYCVNYYDTDNTGIVSKKTATIEVQVPKIGEIVIIAKELGVNRLPRCLGVLKGRNWIDLTEG